MRIAKLFLPAVMLLLCSCSLWQAKEAEVYLQPRLVEAARKAEQENRLSSPALPGTVVNAPRESAVSSVPGPALNRQQTGTSPAPVAAAVPAAVPAPLQRQIQPAGFTLSVNADPRLNRFRDSAHALHLCLYQLKEPNGFRQLSEEREGLARLIECGRFDGSVAHAGRMVVQPGERIRETRERAEGVRYLGIATGYYGSSKQKTIKLVPLPQEGSLAGATVSIDLGPGAIEKITVD